VNHGVATCPYQLMTGRPSSLANRGAGNVQYGTLNLKSYSGGSATDPESWERSYCVAHRELHPFCRLVPSTVFPHRASQTLAPS